MLGFHLGFYNFKTEFLNGVFNFSGDYNSSSYQPFYIKSDIEMDGIKISIEPIEDLWMFIEPYRGIEDFKLLDGYPVPFCLVQLPSEQLSPLLNLFFDLLKNTSEQIPAQNSENRLISKGRLKTRFPAEPFISGNLGSALAAQ